MPAENALIGISRKSDVLIYSKIPSFEPSVPDIITNFNPKEKDKLQILLSQFGNTVGTFKVAKNVNELTKILATPTSFAYLKSTGEIYYNENGASAGFGNGGVFAILEGRPSVTASNFIFT